MISSRTQTRILLGTLGTVSALVGSGIWWLNQRSEEIAPHVRNAADIVLAPSPVEALPRYESRNLRREQRPASTDNRSSEFRSGGLPAVHRGAVNGSEYQLTTFEIPREGIVPNAYGEMGLKLLGEKVLWQGDDAICKLLEGRLPIPVSPEDVRKGIGISEGWVDAALSENSLVLDADTRASVAATTYLAYETIKALSEAMARFPVKSIEDFDRLDMNQRAEIARAIADYHPGHHASFGATVSPLLLPFIQQLVRDPALAERWRQRIFGGR